MLALNLPVFLINPDGWLYPYVHQSRRGINVDSIWAHVPGVSLGVVNVVFFAGFICGVAVLCLLVLRSMRWEAGALLSLLLFMLLTKGYSPQYDLWVLPLLVLLACPVSLWLLFVAADAAYYATVFFFYYIYSGGETVLDRVQISSLLGVAVWGRELALGCLFAWGIALLWRRTGAAAEVSAMPAADGPEGGPKDGERRIASGEAPQSVNTMAK
jgi:hypothetical protein